MSMTEKRCYYEVLEVSRSATSNEIAVAYRKLAIQYHPDKKPGDEEAIVRFKEAAEAFEILSDSEKRTRYDRHGHAGLEGGAGFQDIGDIFEAFGDVFGGGIFGDVFGGGQRGRRVRRGANIQCEITIDLLEAARGVRQTIEFTRQRRCDDCGGNGAQNGTAMESCNYCGGQGQVIQSSGILRMQTTCPSCHGSGQAIKERCDGCRGAGFLEEPVDCEVAVPAGIDDQMQIRLNGEGHPSTTGGPPGDCYCLVHVKDHPLFERQGGHLFCHVPLTYPQAVLGATVSVPTLEGLEEIEIRKGVQPGQVIVLKRQGMPDPRGGLPGDLHVQLNIDVPKKVTDEQEALIRELAEMEHANVTPHRKSFLDKLKEYFVSHETSASDEG